MIRRLREVLPLALLLWGPGAARAQEPVRLSLGEAVGRAVREAPAVELAGSGVRRAQTQVGQARSALLPSIDADASWLNRSYNRASMGFQYPTLPGTAAPANSVGPYDLMDSRLHLSQPLFDPGARGAVRAAKLGAETSRAGQDAAAEAAGLRAALGYVDAVRARSVVAARAADLKLARELVRLAEEVVRAGAGTPLDVTRARVQQLAAEGDSLTAAQAVARSDIGLALALGLPVTTPFLLTDSLGALASAGSLPGADAALARGLAARPELRLEQARQAEVAATRRAIRAERYPRVTLFGDVGWNGTTAANLIPTRQLGLQLSVPLLDGLRREGRIAEQAVLADEAGIRATDARARVEAEVRTALLELASVRDQQRVAAARARLAQLELSQAQALFREGAAGNTEVVGAQRALVAARDAVIAADHTAATARIGLAQATGDAHDLR
jgi:outer membrane protein